MPAWHPHPDVWLLLGGAVIAYEWSARRAGPSLVHPIEYAVSRGQRRLFYAGILTVFVAVDWPVHDLGEGPLFTAHMVEHMLLTLVAPPLIIRGIPAWMMRRALGPLVPVAQRLTRPLVALIMFNAVIAAIHAPVVVDAMLTVSIVHLGAHAALFLSALCMWSPVVTPMIEMPRLTYPQRMFYLFLQSLVPTVPASFLTFGESVLYRHYAEVPRLWGISALTDQRVAGLLFKIGGGLVLWSVIAICFFRWYNLERTEDVDVTGWGTLEPTKVETT